MSGAWFDNEEAAKGPSSTALTPDDLSPTYYVMSSFCLPSYLLSYFSIVLPE